MMLCCSSDSLGRRLSFKASSSFRFKIISRFRCTSSSVRMTVGQEGGRQAGWAGSSSKEPSSRHQRHETGGLLPSHWALTGAFLPWGIPSPQSGWKMGFSMLKKQVHEEGDERGFERWDGLGVRESGFSRTSCMTLGKLFELSGLLLSCLSNEKFGPHNFF